MAHFIRAQEIEPGYCEPDYWLGATMTNMNLVRPGLDKLEKALDCKYVAVEAATAIGLVRSHSLFNAHSLTCHLGAHL
jgi:hypothetical protein